MPPQRFRSARLHRGHRCLGVPAARHCQTRIESHIRQRWPWIESHIRIESNIRQRLPWIESRAGCCVAALGAEHALELRILRRDRAEIGAEHALELRILCRDRVEIGAEIGSAEATPEVWTGAVSLRCRGRPQLAGLGAAAATQSRRRRRHHLTCHAL